MEATLDLKDVRARLSKSMTGVIQNYRTDRRRNDVIDYLPPFVAENIRKRGGDPEDRWSYAHIVKAMIMGRWDVALPEKARIEKALGESTMGAGGIFVPVDQDKDIIEYLNANAIVKKLGVPTRPMKRPTLSLPRQSGTTAAAWGYSGETWSESTNPSWDQIMLVAKHLWAWLYIDNDLIDDADENINLLVRQDGAQQMSLALDLGFFMGTGVAPEPLGMNADDNVNEPDSGGIAVGSLTWEHPKRVLTSVMNDNADFTGWATTPQVWHQLTSIKDGDGKYITNDGDPHKGIPRTLYGYPVELSTQLKSSTTHLLFGGDFKKQAVVGERKGVQMKALTEKRAEYNQTVLAIDARYDVALKQSKAFGKLQITGVTEL